MSNLDSLLDWQILLLMIPYVFSFSIAVYLLWSDKRNESRNEKLQGN